MFAKERYAEIERLLQEEKSVSVSDLKKRFGVSAETVRRDLYALEEEGRLYRVHGGAMFPQTMGDCAPLSSRIGAACLEKRELSEAALSFVREGDTLFLDSGSTAILFAQVMKERFSSLCVITNSLSAVEILKDTDFTLLVTAGEYQKDEEAFGGRLAAESAGMLHARHAFIFPSSVTLEQGAMVFSSALSEVQLAFAQNADRVYCLADSNKFGHGALYRLPLPPYTRYVTDSGIAPETAKRFREAGFHLLLAGEETNAHDGSGTS